MDQRINASPAPLLKLMYAFSPPNLLYITENPTVPAMMPIQNSLTLNIANPEKSFAVQFLNSRRLTDKDPVPAIDDDPGFADLSAIFIYFPWGQDPEDLCSLDFAAKINCYPDSQNISWYTVQRTSEKIGPYWTLFPKNDTVLEPLKEVAFILDNIVSDAAPGMSYMYINTRNIPGYRDDTTVIVVFKEIPSLKIFDFWAEPATIAKGQSSTLSWQTVGADSCGINPGNYEVKPNGHIVVTANETTNFTLTASNAENEASQDLTLYVGYPEILTFEAAPTTIQIGQSATLSWTTQWASDCFIDPGVGKVEVNGSLKVKPIYTTTYTLSCNGFGKPDTDQVTISVPPFNIFAEAACQYQEKSNWPGRLPSSDSFTITTTVKLADVLLAPQKSDSRPVQTMGPIPQAQLFLIDPANLAVLFSKQYYPPYDLENQLPWRDPGQAYKNHWTQVENDIEIYKNSRFIIIYAAAGLFCNYRHFPSPDFYQFLRSCGANLDSWRRLYEYSEESDIGNFVFIGASGLGPYNGCEVFKYYDEGDYNWPAQKVKSVPSASLNVAVTLRQDGSIAFANI